MLNTVALTGLVVIRPGMVDAGTIEFLVLAERGEHMDRIRKRR
jgi:hypothetical protein